jgi:hypothetical protein
MVTGMAVNQQRLRTRTRGRQAARTCDGALTEEQAQERNGDQRLHDYGVLELRKKQETKRTEQTHQNTPERSGKCILHENRCMHQGETGESHKWKKPTVEGSRDSDGMRRERDKTRTADTNRGPRQSRAYNQVVS